MGQEPGLHFLVGVKIGARKFTGFRPSASPLRSGEIWIQGIRGWD